MRQHRQLSDHERAIIEGLLSADFPEVEFFRRQVAAIIVTSICGCGCGSITFAIDETEAPRAPSSAWDGLTGPIVEGDNRHWLMLFQVDGRLTELEHVSEGGPDLRVVDPATLCPDVQVDEDW